MCAVCRGRSRQKTPSCERGKVAEQPASSVPGPPRRPLLAPGVLKELQRQGCRRGVPSSSALGFTERDGRLLGSLLPLILRRSHPRRRRALRLAAPCHHRGRWHRHPRGTQGTQGMGQPRSRRPGEALAQSPVGGPRLKVGEGSLGAEGTSGHGRRASVPSRGCDASSAQGGPGWLL